MGGLEIARPSVTGTVAFTGSAVSAGTAGVAEVAEVAEAQAMRRHTLPVHMLMKLIMQSNTEASLPLPPNTHNVFLSLGSRNMLNGNDGQPEAEQNSRLQKLTGAASSGEYPPFMLRN